MASAGPLGLALIVNRSSPSARNWLSFCWTQAQGPKRRTTKQLFANTFVPVPTAKDALKVRARKWRGFGGN